MVGYSPAASFHFSFPETPLALGELEGSFITFFVPEASKRGASTSLSAIGSGAAQLCAYRPSTGLFVAAALR